MDSPSSPEPAPAAIFTPPPKVPWYSWRRLGYNFLTLSLLVHLLLGIGAAYFVVSVTYPKKKSFAGGAPTQSGAKHAAEHKVSLAKAQQRASAPVAAKRVTTTGVSKVALPAMPAMPLDGSIVPVSLSGMGGAGLGTFAKGGGTGASGGGGGPMIFGVRSSVGGTLVGTFYDLKQTREGQPTEMAISQDSAGKLDINGPANLAYDKATGQFIKGNMMENFLNRYFRGPSPLYTKQIFIPAMSAGNGPKAFNLEDKVQPKRWIVVYRGRVTPPESGGYRFVGWADDVLAVRFNNRLVLDGSLSNPSGARPKTQYAYDASGRPLYVSDQNNVSGGSTYPIEIVIGERPGGSFAAFCCSRKSARRTRKPPPARPSCPS